MSFICLLTEESKDEIKKLLNSRQYYVDVNNEMFFSADTDIINLVLKSITSD